MLALPQKKWTYLGRKKRHIIALKHDKHSGKVIITLNGSLFIKGNVKEKDEVFEFFIDEELCKIIVRFNDETEKYSYQFKAEPQSTSRVSKKRKINEEQMARVGYAFVGALVTLFIIIPVGAYVYFEYIKEAEIEKHAAFTKGTVYAAGLYSRSHKNTHYIYYVNGERHTGGISTPVNDNGEAMSGNGMPVKIGDEFWVQYSKKNPDKSVILFDNPTKEQLKEYHQMAYQKCYYDIKTDQLPQQSVMQYCECLVNFTYKIEGIDGLAHIYYQDESFFVNSAHNSSTYEELAEKEAFAAQQEICREEYLE